MGIHMLLQQPPHRDFPTWLQIFAPILYSDSVKSNTGCTLGVPVSPRGFGCGWGGWTNPACAWGCWNRKETNTICCHKAGRILRYITKLLRFFILSPNYQIFPSMCSPSGKSRPTTSSCLWLSPTCWCRCWWCRLVPSSWSTSTGSTARLSAWSGPRWMSCSPLRPYCTCAASPWTGQIFGVHAFVCWFDLSWKTKPAKI